MTAGMNLFCAFLFCFGFILYFFPTFLAFKREHNNRTAILALNVLLGWTFIGWVISLVWALAKDK